MQEEVLFMGQEENDLGNDLISQALTFRDQVNNNFSQKSSIKRVPIKLRFMYTSFPTPGHFMHSLTILNHGSPTSQKKDYLEWY